jgi:hypothetical protein
VCNIGGPEVARRKAVAKAGGLLFLVFAIFSLLTNQGASIAALAFVPAVIFSIGFVQSRKKFCLAYGLMGTFNFAALGTLSKVTDKQALAADRRTALIIIAQSIGLALVLTAILLAVTSF